MRGHLLSSLESGQLHPFRRFRTCNSPVVEMDITKDTPLTGKRTTHCSSFKHPLMEKHFQTLFSITSII